MESITRRYELECQKRGRYRISQVKAEAVSVLFRHRHILEMDISDELYVYPARINVSSLVRLCDSMLGEVTDQMALAIGRSPAHKILIPMSRCGVKVAGTPEMTIAEGVAGAVKAALAWLGQP